jgi:hypothetical protein
MQRSQSGRDERDESIRAKPNKAGRGYLLNAQPAEESQRADCDCPLVGSTTSTRLQLVLVCWQARGGRRRPEQAPASIAGAHSMS